MFLLPQYSRGIIVDWAARRRRWRLRLRRARPRGALRVVARVVRRGAVVWSSLGVALLALSWWPLEVLTPQASVTEVSRVARADLSRTLSDFFQRGQYPETLPLASPDGVFAAHFRYTVDPALEAAVKDIYLKHKPDYAAFAAVDPVSGKILCMVDYIRGDQELGNLAARTTFPAASVLKIVTAAAALDLGKLEPDSIMPYNGKSNTLYENQVRKVDKSRWTRRVRFRNAFAYSVNPVFGRIGMHTLGREALDDYLARFGFNRSWQSDVEIPGGAARIGDDDWRLAEIGSGFTRTATLSPLHGAMIAAAVVNDGRIPLPYLVDTVYVYDRDGLLAYVPQEARSAAAIGPEAAAKMRVLMQATVKRGSASKFFRGFFRGPLAEAEVGGKTGTLSGRDPRGRNDWFVGYAQLGERKIAFASLNVNRRQWRVRSADVARRVLEFYFAPRRNETPALQTADGGS